ncbi:MAG: two-component system nitrate/nitrite response regulator NarL [Pseudomonadales bacterium]|jgi:two-component system nitrate/nitrite response regulator NarL
MTRILVIDDHELFRIGLKMVLLNQNLLIEKNKAFEVTEADSISKSLKMDAQHPHIILLDINLPRLNGIDGIKLLQRKFFDAQIIMLSASERRIDIEKAAELGARGFINKSAQANTIINAINSVLKGQECFPKRTKASSVVNHKKNVTARQLVVLALICEGKSNASIAQDLDVSKNTVRVHVSAVLSALNVNSRTEAMVAVLSYE